MDDPGIKNILAPTEITVALSAQAFTAAENCDGISGFNLVVKLAGAIGGSTISAVVQTSFDGGNTWYDIARFEFTTSAITKFAVLQTNAAKGITSYVALDSEGVNDGLLGDDFRAVITSTGTYSGTTLSIWGHAH